MNLETEIDEADDDPGPHRGNKTSQPDVHELPYSEALPKPLVICLAHDEATEHEEEVDGDETAGQRARPIDRDMMKYDEEGRDAP
ncbi:hypothetical protein GCM10022276_24460 [Sphingomonas limnosediminicola]|uniref:Uncharacterized protein n=1 Tax=Sphingomonas limnosediminicola TaxID=940133 RepID=A0ABP7LQE9_9SPHN